MRTQDEYDTFATVLWLTGQRPATRVAQLFDSISNLNSAICSSTWDELMGQLGYSGPTYEARLSIKGGLGK